MANNNRTCNKSNPQRRSHGSWQGGNEQNIRGDKSGNLSLLFTRRYFEELTIPLVERINKEKDNERFKVQQNSQREYYKVRNNNLIWQAKSFEGPKGMKSKEEDATISQIELVTTYPGLLIGTGIIHSTGHLGETKLGLMFDHTTGLPYLPGSSVKGLLRSMFPLRDIEVARNCESQAKKETDSVKKDELLRKAKTLKKQADEKRSLIAGWLSDENFTREMVDDLERSIFDGVEYKIDEKTGISEPVHISRRDIFFDAFPTKAGEHGLLGLDYITPHKDEFKNPTPIQFLRIEPGVVFRFEFRLRDSMKLGEVLYKKSKKEALFYRILTTIGIGAKTNVGYGQLKKKKEKD